jgi:hypothetical protein
MSLFDQARCTACFSTYSVHGLSEYVFICAAKINALGGGSLKP